MPISFNNNLMALGVSNNLESHYARLSVSVQRLSSGLRINSAADDAAGLAIRELMRSDVAALNQGIRNANDAISMIQVADGALGVIDEKLIRMKELAEQAATGTYNSTQRLMIDSEFQAMASEIERIARATDFNGIKLLDGSLQGEHDGSGLDSTGKLKVHFGSANDSAEDYYYVEIGDCTLAGLGLREPHTATALTTLSTDANTAVQGNNTSTQANGYGNVPILSDAVTKGKYETTDISPNLYANVVMGIIPAGTTDFTINFTDNGLNNTIQIFTRDGKHLAGTTLDKWNEASGLSYPTQPPIVPSDFINENNGFLPNANYDSSQLNGIQGGGNLTFNKVGSYPTWKPVLQNFTSHGINISYTGDDGTNPNPILASPLEELKISNVTEDLIIIVQGYESFGTVVDWTYMPNTVNPPPNPGPGPNPPQPDQPTPSPQGDIISIKTQEKAQKALERIDDAIVAKDKVRANLGATQNRLENTVTNLTIMAENMLSAESRISDADIGAEMMVFVKNQILTQSSVAMLSQANSWPHMLMSLIGG